MVAFQLAPVHHINSNNQRERSSKHRAIHVLLSRRPIIDGPGRGMIMTKGHRGHWRTRHSICLRSSQATKTLALTSCAPQQRFREIGLAWNCIRGVCPPRVGKWVDRCIKPMVRSRLKVFRFPCSATSSWIDRRDWRRSVIHTLSELHAVFDRSIS